MAEWTVWDGKNEGHPEELPLICYIVNQRLISWGFLHTNLSHMANEQLKKKALI